MSNMVVKFPLMACVFYLPGDYGPTNAVDEWCEEMIPGRYYELMGGDHEFQYDDLDSFGAFQDTYCAYYVFRDADAMMLFKLRWGGSL